MRRGFGMPQGPFELWQPAGWLEVARMVQEDIDAGRARQPYRGRVVGEGGPDRRTDGATVHEDAAIRLWTRPRPGPDDVLTASLKT